MYAFINVYFINISDKLGLGMISALVLVFYFVVFMSVL